MLDDRTTTTHVDLTLPPGTSSVRTARHEVEDLVADYPDDVRTTVALLTSELASNAVVHANTSFTVRAYADREVVRVAISDSGETYPVMVRHRTTRGGWGLKMVDAAASRWGIAVGDHTTVWFEIDLL